MAAVFGCLGTCLGAWIKVLGVHPDLFYVAFIGQSVVAASQVFILSLPAKLAAVWFGPNQVSSACSIGVFGNQVSLFLFAKIHRACGTNFFNSPQHDSYKSFGSKACEDTNERENLSKVLIFPPGIRRDSELWVMGEQKISPLIPSILFLPFVIFSTGHVSLQTPEIFNFVTRTFHPEFYYLLKISFEK